MASRINLRRDNVAGSAYPTLSRGEIFVHLADLQLVVGLEDEFSTKELIPLRFFDVSAQYILDDLVSHEAALYKCINGAGVPPGAFDIADWQAIDAQALYDLHVVTLYDPNRAYVTDDVIHYGGSIYAALIDAPADPATNPEDWKNIGASAVEDIIQEFQRVLDEDVTVYNYLQTNAYSTGDVVYKDGDIYRALEDVPADEVWDGSKWELIQHAVMYAQDTPPTNPGHGLMWWDSKSGETFIYYEDSTTGQWVSTLYGAPGSVTPFEFPDAPVEAEEYSPVAGLRYVWFDDPGVWRGDPDLFVKITGSTMTGALILRANAPQSDYESVHKLYVDTTFAEFFSVNDLAPTVSDGVAGQFWFVRE